jgi:hypothetical protein
MCDDNTRACTQTDHPADCTCVFAVCLQINCRRYTVGYQSYSLVLVAYEADTSKADLPAGLGVYLVTEQA